MIKECPVCHKPFDAWNDQKVYCNISCRKRANHEKEKAQRSAFYSGPKDQDIRILHSLHRPTLQQVIECAELLEHFTRVTRTEKAVMIYGLMPEGWQNTASIDIWEQIGTSNKSWGMMCKLPVDRPLDTTGRLIEKPLPHQRQEIATAVINRDKEAEDELERLER